MIREIGSEFWNDGPVKKNEIYLLSGRTALEYIIRDIIKNHDVESVLIPSYCCHTMIEPFVRNNISVRFYDVYFSEFGGLSVDIPSARKNEIFYYMTYFGFCHLNGADRAKLREEFTVIIKDNTHSWLSKDNDCCADYSYVSYRKWTGFDAISCAKKINGFFSEFPKEMNIRYSDIRKQAFSMKRTFMNSGVGKKQTFLKLFSDAENVLETDYVGYKPSTETMAAFLQLDTEYIVKKRQQNAKILIDGLKGISEIKLIFQSLQLEETPLFVPVLIRENRDALRKFLIDNEIFCPIHWPKSNYHSKFSQRAEEIYNQELSLVCDQRYDFEDMERMVSCIKKYYKR